MRDKLIAMAKLMNDIPYEDRSAEVIKLRIDLMKLIDTTPIISFELKEEDFVEMPQDMIKEGLQQAIDGEKKQYKTLTLAEAKEKLFASVDKHREEVEKDRKESLMDMFGNCPECEDEEPPESLLKGIEQAKAGKVTRDAVDLSEVEIDEWLEEEGIKDECDCYAQRVIDQRIRAQIEPHGLNHLRECTCEDDGMIELVHEIIRHEGSVDKITRKLSPENRKLAKTDLNAWMLKEGIIEEEGIKDEVEEAVAASNDHDLRVAATLLDYRETASAEGIRLLNEDFEGWLKYEGFLKDEDEKKEWTGWEYAP